MFSEGARGGEDMQLVINEEPHKRSPVHHRKVIEHIYKCYRSFRYIKVSRADGGEDAFLNGKIVACQVSLIRSDTSILPILKECVTFKPINELGRI